jgi:ribosome-binding protein aMBF1 (putative translation factor)
MARASTSARLVIQPEPTATDLAVLKPRERKVLALRQTLSLQAISLELNVSKERVRQIQNRAIEKLAKRMPGLKVITRRDLKPAKSPSPAAKSPITAEMVGERIRALLNASGLTQQQLADAAGTSQPAINDYLHGRVMPTLPILERIAWALGARLRQVVDPD